MILVWERRQTEKDILGTMEENLYTYLEIVYMVLVCSFNFSVPLNFLIRRSWGKYPALPDGFPCLLGIRNYCNMG